MRLQFFSPLSLALPSPCPILSPIPLRHSATPPLLTFPHPFPPPHILYLPLFPPPRPPPPHFPPLTEDTFTPGFCSDYEGAVYIKVWLPPSCSYQVWAPPSCSYQVWAPPSCSYQGAIGVIVLYQGAMGVTVRNDYAHDFIFASPCPPTLPLTRFTTAVPPLPGVDTPIVLYQGAIGMIVHSNYAHDFIFAFSLVPPSLPSLTGVDTPIVLYQGAIGVIVRNNYVHDFIFAGIRCGADVHYAADCVLATISYNIVVAAGTNRSGDQDAAGIYFCTHWFSPGGWQ
ncbi:unnamed protein product [Closterium sp. Naga37s-1]|nr:unnamed protein product [Closterium sp. Naga37s-1]